MTRRQRLILGLGGLALAFAALGGTLLVVRMTAVSDEPPLCSGCG